MKERIATIISKEGITAAQFAEKIGISASSLSHILSGRNNPSLEVVTKIHKSCNYIQLNWLLYGEGAMEQPTNHYMNSVNPDIEHAENPLFAPNDSIECQNSKDNPLESALIAPKVAVKEHIKYIEIPQKKITEIRIFFDNGTYETFRPDSK